MTSLRVNLTLFPRVPQGPSPIATNANRKSSKGDERLEKESIALRDLKTVGFVTRVAKGRGWMGEKRVQVLQLRME
jgi:hypothetical protein